MLYLRYKYHKEGESSLNDTRAMRRQGTTRWLYYFVGSLEAGKLADFVLLEDDARRVEATAISDIKVSETWMDGTQVYGA